MNSPLLRWDVSSPREVALARMMALGIPVEASSSTFSLPIPASENNADADQKEELGIALSGSDGLAAPLTTLLSCTYDEWLRSTRMRCKQVEMEMTEGVHDEEKKNEDDDDQHDHSTSCLFIVHETQATDSLRRVLQLHTKVCQLDSTLAEELEREGSHAVLAKLIRFDLQSEMDRASFASFDMPEEDADAVMELQDLACEIGSMSGGSFPIKVAPFTREELRSRLPLRFSCSSVAGSHEELDCQQHQILIHQVTARRQGAQEDVWLCYVAIGRGLSFVGGNQPIKSAR